MPPSTGRVQPGRDFRLDLAVLDDGKRLRIEVTDTRGECLPSRPGPGGSDHASESGRGLLIVEALAARWGVTPGPLPRKTVWAEIGLLPYAANPRHSHG